MKTLALVAVAAALVVPSALAKSSGTLVGTVGPGFTITLTKAGKKVTTLPAGTYTIKVQDKSNIHNFHLTGPGVNKRDGRGRRDLHVDRQAEEGHLQVRLRPPRVVHEGLLQGDVGRSVLSR